MLEGLIVSDSSMDSAVSPVTSTSTWGSGEGLGNVLAAQLSYHLERVLAEWVTSDWDGQNREATPEETSRTQLEGTSAPRLATSPWRLRRAAYGGWSSRGAGLRGKRYAIDYSRSVRGSPKCGNTLVSGKPVIAAMRSPLNVSTMRPYACAIGARASRT